MEECITPYRVWFSDLDVLRHMNNGVYLSLQDLARMDYMIRAQAAPIIRKNNWYPVVASETIRFRKSLHFLQKFQIHTRLISWDEKYIFLEHKFVSHGQVIALGMIRARFLKKSGGTVSPQELLQALNLNTEAPPQPQHLKDWLSADQGHPRSLGL